MNFQFFDFQRRSRYLDGKESTFMVEGTRNRIPGSVAFLFAWTDRLRSTFLHYTHHSLQL